MGFLSFSLWVAAVTNTVLQHLLNLKIAFSRLKIKAKQVSEFFFKENAVSYNEHSVTRKKR